MTTNSDQQGQWWEGSYYSEPFLSYLIKSEFPGRRMILEPSIGSGNLVEVWEGTDATVAGMDTDPDAIDRVKQHRPWIRSARKDFLRVEPRRLFDLIVTNPPYVKRSRVGKTTMDRMVQIERELGFKFAFPSIWMTFLAQSTRWLQPGGGIAAVVPRSMTFTQAGRKFTRWLQERFGSFKIVAFREKVTQGTNLCYLLLLDRYQGGGGPSRIEYIVPDSISAVYDAMVAGGSMLTVDQMDWCRGLEVGGGARAVEVLSHLHEAKAAHPLRKLATVSSNPKVGGNLPTGRAVLLDSPAPMRSTLLLGSAEALPGSSWLSAPGPRVGWWWTWLERPLLVALGPCVRPERSFEITPQSHDSVKALLIRLHSSITMADVEIRARMVQGAALSFTIGDVKRFLVPTLLRPAVDMNATIQEMQKYAAIDDWKSVMTIADSTLLAVDRVATAILRTFVMTARKRRMREHTGR